jgi:WD40 repeat protein
LLACQNTNNISVFKFYMPENPIVFKTHTSLIKSIAWFEDDTGFVSSGWDNAICVWKLKKEDHLPVWEYKMKSITFTCVTTFKPEGSLIPLVYTVGNDRTIREL